MHFIKSEMRRNHTQFYLICAVITGFIFPSINCYFVNVDAHAEECFFDKVTAGTKMGLTFEVAEGGFLDIDVTVSKLSAQIIEIAEKKKWAIFFLVHKGIELIFVYNI